MSTTAKHASSVVVGFCEHGHVHIDLYDDQHEIIATITMSPEGARNFARDIIDNTKHADAVELDASTDRSGHVH